VVGAPEFPLRFLPASAPKGQHDRHNNQPARANRRRIMKMGINRKAKHTNGILESKEELNGHFVMVERNLPCMKETQKRARQLAAESPGTTYVPCRIYPGLKARSITTIKFVNPTDYKEQQTGKAGEEEAAI
jgi:hypothetical protein